MGTFVNHGTPYIPDGKRPYKYTNGSPVGWKGNDKHNNASTIPEDPTSPANNAPKDSRKDGIWGNDKDLLTVKWNPPPHIATKPPRIAWQGYDLSKDHVQVVDDGTYADSGVYQRVDPGRLGALYNRADVFEKMDGTVTPPRWGCQFHYNPTTLSYNANVDPSISAIGITDTTRVARPLGAGTMDVNLELYFNRIYDMSLAPKYPIPLKTVPENQQSLIQQLGTEYDLEFLYRVINGDPKPLRTGRTSANFGLLVTRVIELRVGPFHWLGYVSGMSVNHILFTPKMVPTFTTVSLTFTRIMDHDGYELDGTLTDTAATSPTGGPSNTAGTPADGVYKGPAGTGPGRPTYKGPQ